MNALQYFHLNDEVVLPAPDDFAPFKAIVADEIGVSTIQRNVVCEWLVKSGCLYGMMWGISCKQWHDNLDDVLLEQFDWQPPPEDRFIMTSWHENEPLSEVLWFAKNCADQGSVKLNTLKVLHFGEENIEAGIRAAYEEA